MDRSIEGLEFRLTMPGCQIDGVTAEFFEGKNTLIPWARIILPDEFPAELKASRIEDCELEIGSDGEFETLLDGIGEMTENMDGILLIRSRLQILRENRICNTFLRCHPQEAVRYILTVSGVDNYHMTDEQFPAKDVFSIDDMDALEAMKQINSVYGINMEVTWMDDDFWWGTKPEQEDVAELTDDNVMNMEKTGSEWEAVILPIPWIRTGEQILVDCEEYQGMGTVTKRVIKGTGNQIDMYINFEEADDDE